MTQNSISNTASTMDIDNIRLNGNVIAITDTDGNLVIAPDGTGVVSVTDASLVPSGDRAEDLGSSSNNWGTIYADGLSFDDATNVMASYVGETSWTPVVEGVSTAGVGTYTTQVGAYIRVGNLMFVTFNLDWSAHTGTGFMTITGLPFAIANPNQTVGTVQAINGVTYPANTLYLDTFANYNLGTNEIQIQGMNTVGNAIAPLVESNQAVGIRGSIIYMTS